MQATNTAALPFIGITAVWLDEIADNYTEEQFWIAIHLLSYCARYPANLGRIPGARNWTREQWLRKCNIRQALTEEIPGAFTWEKNDLILNPTLAEKLTSAIERRDNRAGIQEKKSKREAIKTPPRTIQQVLNVMQHAASKLPDIYAQSQEEIAACASRFFESGRASNWELNGAPMRDWKDCARAYLKDNLQHRHNNAYTNSPRKTRPVIDPLEGAFDDPDRF